MSQLEPQLDSEKEVSQQTVRALAIIIWVTWAGYLSAMISGLFLDNWLLVWVALISSVLLLIPFWLLKRGKFTISANLLVGMALGTVTLLATMGQGSHDFSIMAYPVIIIYASLALNRVSFRICVLLTFAAVAWLVLGEMGGLFVSRPFENPSAVDFLPLAAILIAAVWVIDLLATNMRKDLALARSEVSKRNQANEALRESETHTRTLLDQLPDAVFVHDFDGKLVEVNHEACRRLGYSKDELLQKHFNELTLEKPIPQEPGLLQDDPAFWLKQLHDSGHATHIGEHISKTGERYPCEIVISRIQYKGQPRVLSISRDISERKIAEDALLESEARFRKLFEGHSAVKLLIDLDSGNILDANTAAVNFYGWSIDQLKQMNIQQINTLPPEAVKSEMDKAVSPQSGRYLEFRHRRADGSIKDVEVFSNKIEITGKVLQYSIIHDISNRRRMEQELLLSELDLKEAQSIAHIGSWKWDVNSREVIWSDEMFRIFGIDKNSYTGRLGDAAQKAMHPDDLYIVMPENAPNIANVPFEYRIIRPDGVIRHIWAKAANTIFDQEGKPTFLFGIAQDITERKQAEAAQSELMDKLETHQIELQMQNKILVQTHKELDDVRAKYFDLYNLAPTGYLTLNVEGKILDANLSAANLLGMDKIELIKQPLSRFIYKEDQDIYFLHRKQLLDTRATQVRELRIVGKAGALHWVHLEGKVAQKGIGSPVFLEMISDITERKQAEEQLRHQSTHDALTGIFNRTFFEVELARLEHSRDFPISIIVADVDKLKETNDKQGHPAGDEVLRQAANALREVFREADVLVRIGGDEFAVILPTTDSSSAEQMLTRVREHLAQQNSENSDLPVQLSLGMATAENGGLVAAYTLADQRMYADKVMRKAKAEHTFGLSA